MTGLSCRDYLIVADTGLSCSTFCAGAKTVAALLDQMAGDDTEGAEGDRTETEEGDGTETGLHPGARPDAPPDALRATHDTETASLDALPSFARAPFSPAGPGLGPWHIPNIP